MTTATRAGADLAWLGDLPGRCPRCYYHVEMQGHRSELADGTPTGCGDSGAIWAAEQHRRDMRANVDADTREVEWKVFEAAVRADASAHSGWVSQNRLRVSIGHRWASTKAKRRYSNLWSRARKCGLLVEPEPHERRMEKSNDKAGGNSHRDVPLLKLGTYRGDR